MNILKTDSFLISYPGVKSVVVSGDIHGDFDKLIFKMCEQYRMTDTLMIIAGDCGFGFERPGYYENLGKKNTPRMSKANNWLVFVRGNHDNPEYFDGKVFKHERFLTVPDYSVIQACSRSILCVGGAISVDRSCRLEWRKHGKEVYWENEAPVFDKVKLDLISESIKVDTVITHSAPSFCELTNKSGLSQWSVSDGTLEADVALERQVMDNIYKSLKQHKHPLQQWYYGHFHQSWRASIDGIMFKMLDILEFCEIY